MRLFAAVWPPPEVLPVLDALPRPPRPGVRWMPPDRWHVTLAYFGELSEAEEELAVAALGAAARRVAGAPEAVAGPVTTVLGRSVLCARVGGLEAAASAVRAEAGGSAIPVDPEPYAGHLTLARSRGPVPPDLVGIPVAARWAVGRLSLVASRRGAQGTRYETVSEATVQ